MGVIRLNVRFWERHLRHFGQMPTFRFGLGADI